MALEENIVKRDVFDAGGLGVPDDFQNAIDHQHRIAVGEYSLDSADVHGRVAMQQVLAVRRFLLLEKLAGQHMIEAMPALIGDDSAAKGAADEKQIADQIEHLMSAAFVGEAKCVVDRAIAADHQQVLGGEMFSQAMRPKFARFLFEHK